MRWGHFLGSDYREEKTSKESPLEHTTIQRSGRWRGISMKMASEEGQRVCCPRKQVKTAFQGRESVADRSSTVTDWTLGLEYGDLRGPSTVLMEGQEQKPNSCGYNRKGMEGEWRKEIDTTLCNFAIKGSRVWVRYSALAGITRDLVIINCISLVLA